jgi:hypothetical protein
MFDVPTPSVLIHPDILYVVAGFTLTVCTKRASSSWAQVISALLSPECATPETAR